MFEVKSGIEAPTSGSRDKIYPFDTMKVGDHFEAPRDMGRTRRGQDARQGSIGVCSRAYAKKHNPEAKFTVRVIDENTVRCWRIK